MKSKVHYQIKVKQINWKLKGTKWDSKEKVQTDKSI